MTISLPRGVRRAFAGAVVLAAVAVAIPASATPTMHSFSATSSLGTNVKISSEGLVTMFVSPNNFYASYGHLDNRDGYMLCDSKATYYQTGVNGFGNSGFGPTTTSGGTTTFNVTRSSTDKRIKLTQNFTFIPVMRAVTVKMTVLNTSQSPIDGMRIRRYADVDTDNAGGLSTNNSFSRTTDSAMAWNEKNDLYNLRVDGFTMTNLENPPGIDAHTEVGQNNFPTTCSSLSSNTPMNGDKAAGLFYSLPPIAPGKSVSITLAYQRL